MAGYVVVGAQWGDEGKGKVVDLLGGRVSMVVRFQGGNNAGHTVVVNGRKTVLHLLPSGILNHDALCVIAAGVVVNPFILLQEIDALEAQGSPCDHVRIDGRAHLIMPWHIRLDCLEEERTGGKIGTTKNGIGPCYADKYTRIGLRVCDLKNPAVFAAKLKEVLEIKNRIITAVYGGEPFVYDEVLNQFMAIRERILPMICDAVTLINDALEHGRDVLFEGAQANMLDINYGTYPYVTSSSPTAAGVLEGAGTSPQHLGRIIGVVKAYSTRVGGGPFVTELDNEIGERLRKTGNEYGATTGRPRRCGWLDLPVVKQACRLNGLTDIALTKIDVLSGFKSIQVCTGYEIDGVHTDALPMGLEELEKAKPVYQTFPGWEEDISQITSFEDLPYNARKYIRFIEDYCGVKITLVSVNPERNGNIMRREL